MSFGYRYPIRPHAFSLNSTLKMIICRLHTQWQCVDMARSHLRCVVHLDLGDLPVAGLCVVLQPGLAGKEAAHSEQPHACQQREEATLPADILPGQHRQHLSRVRPLHRLIVQGVLLGLPRPGLQLSVRPDLPSHFCYEAKTLFLHHDCLMCSSYSTILTDKQSVFLLQEITVSYVTLV